MSFSIRSAESRDAEALFSMIVELASYEEEAHSVKVTANDLLQQLNCSNPPFACIIAENDGQPCGFALYFYAYSTWEGTRTLYLEDLYVRPQFRGAKAGIALMAHLAQIAREQNCQRFEWSVLNWNQPAINFYESLGARPLTEWTRYRMDADAIQSMLGGKKLFSDLTTG